MDERMPFGTNYYDVSFNGQVGGRSSSMNINLSANGEGKYILLFPSVATNSNIRLYVRIGIPMNIPFHFKGISAKIITS